MKKYVVYGGCVNNMEQRKYVSPQEVMRLYNVAPHECVVAWDPVTAMAGRGIPGLRSHREHLIKLEPQPDPENYKKLPQPGATP